MTPNMLDDTHLQATGLLHRRTHPTEGDYLEVDMNASR